MQTQDTGSGGTSTSSTTSKYVFILESATPRPLQRLSPDPNHAQTFYVSIVFYNVGLFCIKTTFLLQYYRTFATNKRTRTILIIASVIVVGWSISQVGVQIFICTPVAAFWDSKNVKGTCIPNIPQWYINAGGNILTDIMVLTLPLPIIRRLNLAKNQKYMLMGVFCLGFL